MSQSDISQRFMEKILVAESGCWEWTSTLSRTGYGKFWLIDRQVPAHRVSFELFKGNTSGKWVLHTCDNRKCVNPAHLYLGDAKQNCLDRTERKRYKVVLPLGTVNEIRLKYAEGKVSQQALADEYGINQTQVSRYVRLKQRIDY